MHQLPSLALGTVSPHLKVTNATVAMSSLFDHAVLVGKTVSEVLPGSAAVVQEAFRSAALGRPLPVRQFVARGKTYQASFHAECHPSGSVSQLLVIATDVTKQAAMERQVREARRRLVAANRRDYLTGLLNRRGLDVVLHRQLRVAKRVGAPLSLLMIDVDWFKSYNDHLGHLEGDACLKRVAAVIAGSLRSREDAACRYGGEEFVVVLPNTDASDAVIIADKCKNAILELKRPHPSSLSRVVTVSIGVAEIRLSADNTPCQAAARDLLARADRALYAAKKAGRNCVKD